MKKSFLVLAIVFVVTGSVFAQSYTVQTVTGRVQREDGAGRVDVKVNDTLSADTVIYTGVGASLVLKDGDKTFTVPAVRSGKVAELIASASGVTIGGNVATTDTGKVSRNTAQLPTASARAADANGNEDIASE